MFFGKWKQKSTIKWISKLPFILEFHHFMIASLLESAFFLFFSEIIIVKGFFCPQKFHRIYFAWTVTMVKRQKWRSLWHSKYFHYYSKINSFYGQLCTGMRSLLLLTRKKGDQVAKMLGKHQNMPPKNVLLHIPAYMFGYTQVSINNEHTE